jgi:hypothetical protein
MTVPDDVNWLSRIDAEQLRTKEDLPAREELLRTSQGAAGLGSWEYDFLANPSPAMRPWRKNRLELEPCCRYVVNCTFES